MAEELKEKDGCEAGFPEEEITMVMQSILYEDCIMIRQHKQLLEDEQYAKELQERFHAELEHRTMSLSVTETDDEYDGVTNIYEPVLERILSTEPSSSHSSGNCYSTSFTSTSSSSISEHGYIDSDDEPPPYAEYEGILQEMDLSESGFASSSLIDLLPTRSYSSSTLLDITSDNKSCLICLLDWKTGDSIKSLPCFHDFHSDCIDKWLMIKESCPVCRHDITY